MSEPGYAHSAAARFEMFCEAADAARKEYAIPGVAVGVLCGDEEFSAGFGVTNVNHPLAVDGDTLFQIGSTSKTFAATVAIQLVEAGKLDLDRPVREYLPDLVLADAETTAKVTLRHLLTHTGGWVGDFFANTGRGEDALWRYVKRMRELRQEVPLGEAFAYNNAGFILAGLLIEEVAGKAYEQVVKEMLLEPLGMQMTFYLPEDVMVHRFAVGHLTPPEGVATVATPWALSRAAYPAGGVVSSAKDQLRYARFQLGEGTAPNGKRLLQNETLKMMQKPQLKAAPWDEVGFSWLLTHPAGLDMVGHGGATNAQYSAFELVPARAFAITLLTNGSRGGRFCRTMTKRALEILLDVTVPTPEPIERSAAELAPFVGHYCGRMADIAITIEGKSLILTQQMHGGFPEEESPPPPSPPPGRFVFTSPDRIHALEGPFAGAKAEFAHHADGSVRWLHLSGRIHHRVD